MGFLRSAGGAGERAAGAGRWTSRSCLLPCFCWHEQRLGLAGCAQQISGMSGWHLAHLVRFSGSPSLQLVSRCVYLRAFAARSSERPSILDRCSSGRTAVTQAEPAHLRGQAPAWPRRDLSPPPKKTPDANSHAVTEETLSGVSQGLSWFPTRASHLPSASNLHWSWPKPPAF